MWKWIGLLIVAALIYVTYVLVGTFVRITPPWAQPKLAEVERGGISVPITSAGLIEPAQRIEVKSEASGEVALVRVREGDYVRAGDELVLLERDDEERSVYRAKAAVAQGKAALEKSRVAVLQARQQIIINEARVAELEAQLKATEFDYNRKRELMQQDVTSELEMINAEARLGVAKAQLAQAVANVEVSKNNLADAEQSVIIQTEALTASNKDLEEADKRLSETSIRAHIDALVTDVKVRPGMLVQSGKSALTGGTSVLTLADISTIKVLARVDEADYGKVHDIAPVDALPDLAVLQAATQAAVTEFHERTGKVRLFVDAFPNDEFAGVIERVEPQGELSTGASVIQFDVYVLVTDDNRGKLPLGAQAQVEFKVDSVADVIKVPAEAVKTLEGERGVYIKTTEGLKPGEFGKKFIRCRFGVTDGEFTEVVSSDQPLEAGQEVYTKLPPDPEDDDS